MANVSLSAFSKEPFSGMFVHNIDQILKWGFQSHTVYFWRFDVFGCGGETYKLRDGKVVINTLLQNLAGKCLTASQMFRNLLRMCPQQNDADM